MDKKAKIASVFAVLFSVLVLVVAVLAAPKQCNDSIDNDGDGLNNYPADPGCSSRNDNSETSPSLACDNGADATNDRDTLADYRLSGGDPGCTSATDPSEIDGQCDDNLDSSDRDTLGDATDPGCTSTSDQTETDGICDDNADDSSDRDALGDASDPGCSSTTDTTEIDGECDDSIDGGDRDTLPDVVDPGCASTNDPTEADGICDDNVDDASDADAIGDIYDPGCSSTTDTTEIDGECDDFLDNDGDTFTDYGGDPSCTFYTDPSEFGTTECDDGIDQPDTDTAVDYPDDSGCGWPGDPGEVSGECDNGADDDGDGHADFGTANPDSKCLDYTSNEWPRDSCADTDGGSNAAVFGTVSGDNEDLPYSFSDACIDALHLREFSCGGVAQDYAPLNSTANCTGNQTCSGGACA